MLLKLATTFYSSLQKKRKRRYLDMLIRNGLRIGENVAILDPFFFDPSHCFLITIGDNCRFAPGVRLIAHDASTKGYLGYTKIGKITIGDNCFIGDSVIVLPAVSIGSGSIIGAGSVVTKDIKAGQIAVGNPAKVICSVADYIEQMEQKVEEKGGYGEEYLIENLDVQKRTRMLEEIGNDTGFIV